MAITTNWSVTKLDSDVETNTVFNVHISLTASDGTNTFEKKFVVGLQHAEDDVFIPYNELTEQLILDWVKVKLDQDVERFEEEVIAALSQTTTVQSGLPW